MPSSMPSPQESQPLGPSGKSEEQKLKEAEAAFAATLHYLVAKGKGEAFDRVLGILLNKCGAGSYSQAMDYCDRFICTKTSLMHTAAKHGQHGK